MCAAVACQSNRRGRDGLCRRQQHTWGSMDNVARAEAPVSPRGSPPRLLDLRRGRGLVIVTGGPPCVSDAALGGLNGGKGSSLLSAIVKFGSCNRVQQREGATGNKKMITAGSRGASASAAPTAVNNPNLSISAPDKPTNFTCFTL